MTLRWIVTCMLLFALDSVGACSCGPPDVCTTDSQCDATGQGYNKCSIAGPTKGTCICADDRGCGGNGEFCNARGSCQAIVGCGNNEDCANTDLFCDVTSSRCLSLTECDGDTCCTQDSQCPFGSVCDPAVHQACVPGCRDDGDCVLGLGCTSGGLGSLGTCGSACTADNQCLSQYLCNLGRGECELDTRAPYCQACTGGVASDDCGTPGNYCLIDTTINSDPPTEFCGADCSNGQGCPASYGCEQVIIVPPSTPQCGVEICNNNVCSTSGGACANNEDCPIGPPYGDCAQRFNPERAGNCDTAPFGVCDADADCDGTCILKECRGSGEAGVLGFCSCTTNSDCPSDTCKDADPGAGIKGHCELSGHECLQGAECDTITCVEGGCLIGSNCAPANDRSCGDLLP